MKTHTIWEPMNVFEEVNENHDIEVGDIIVYLSYNQMGNAKYKVIAAPYKKKDVQRIGDYDDWTNDNDLTNDNKEDKEETT